MNKNELLKKITKDIRIIKKKNQNNGNVSHRLVLELNGGYSTEIPMISEDIQLLNLLKQIGYEEPIISKALVEEVSKDTGEVYVCVRFDLAEGTVLRYFLPKTNNGFRFKSILDKLVEFTEKQLELEEKNTKKINKE